jgi:hypothetical protein
VPYPHIGGIQGTVKGLGRPLSGGLFVHPSKEREAALDGPVLINFEGWSLLTRDARRYRTYFPKLTLVAPPV